MVVIRDLEEEDELMLSEEEDVDMDTDWEELLTFAINEDKSFMSQVKEKTFENLHDRLERAFADTGTAQLSENHKGAVASLKKHELVVVPTTIYDETSSSLGRFLCSTILNYHNAHPGQAASPCINFGLRIKEHSHEHLILIPNRSRLVLLYIAEALRINIFLFSNRSKPTVFLCPAPGSSQSIGFYNRVDSYRSTNTFLWSNQDVEPSHFRPKRANQFVHLCSVEYLSSAVRTAVSAATKPMPTNVLRKPKKVAPNPMEKAKGDLWKRLNGCQRVPPGVIANAVKEAEEYLGESNYRNNFLRDLGKKVKSVDVWFDAKQSFNTTWEMAVSETRTVAATDLSTTGPSTSTQSCSSTEPATVEDAKGEHRTCTVTLDSILRTDLTELAKNRIGQILVKSQQVVSNVIGELQCIVHKAVFSIASGAIYPSDLGPSTTTHFDISAILPDRYQIQPSKRLLDVAPIPKDLQDIPPRPLHPVPPEPLQSAPSIPPQAARPEPPKRMIPVLCIGDAGTGVGSRIKGFSRRGGKRLRFEHRQHTVVAITPEYRTSKTCSFCFSTLQKPRHRRIQGDTIKEVTINGALEFWNQECPSFVHGRNISNRDQLAALNIGLVGASLLLSPDHQVLPAFARHTI